VEMKQWDIEEKIQVDLKRPKPPMEGGSGIRRK